MDRDWGRTQVIGRNGEAGDGDIDGANKQRGASGGSIRSARCRRCVESQRWCLLRWRRQGRKERSSGDGRLAGRAVPGGGWVGLVEVCRLVKWWWRNELSSGRWRQVGRWWHRTIVRDRRRNGMLRRRSTLAGTDAWAHKGIVGSKHGPCSLVSMMRALTPRMSWNPAVEAAGVPTVTWWSSCMWGRPT